MERNNVDSPQAAYAISFRWGINTIDNFLIKWWEKVGLTKALSRHTWAVNHIDGVISSMNFYFYDWV